MGKHQQAANIIKEQVKSGISYEELGEITGFNYHKLYQWAKVEKFPSMKIVKKIIRLKFPLK